MSKRLRRLGITVAGIVGSSRERAAPKAAAMRLGKVYAAYEEMLADPAIGAVHITSPNHLHYPQAKAALLAGKHVVCEKPLAMDTQESAELVALAKERNPVNAVNFKHKIRVHPCLSASHS